MINKLVPTILRKVHQSMKNDQMINQYVSFFVVKLSDCFLAFSLATQKTMRHLPSSAAVMKKNAAAFIQAIKRKCIARFL